MIKSLDDNVFELCCHDFNILQNKAHFNCISDSETLKKLWTGNWNIEETEICKQLFSCKLENDTLLEILQKYSDDSFTEKILDIAISAFLTYCNSNWSTVSKNIELEEYFGIAWPEDVDVHTKLQCDSEPICSNILYPELLYFSSQIFNTLYTIDQDLVRNKIL